MTLARRAMLALSIALATALLVGALAAIDAATVRRRSNGFNGTEHGKGQDVTKEAKPKPAGKAERAVYRTVINAPIETVWNTLVKTDAVLPFFFGAVCQTADGLKPGRRMRMVTPDKKFAAVVGEVLEFSPPHRYSHTMAFTQFEGEPPSTIIYELKEVPGGTEFSLITENVPAGTKSEKSMAQGGPFIIENLKKLVETGKPAFSGSMVMALNPLMGLMTPKICRIENWPLT